VYHRIHSKSPSYHDRNSNTLNGNDTDDDEDDDDDAYDTVNCFINRNLSSCHHPRLPPETSTPPSDRQLDRTYNTPNGNEIGDDDDEDAYDTVYCCTHRLLTHMYCTHGQHSRPLPNIPALPSDHRPLAHVDPTGPTCSGSGPHPT